VAEGDRPLLNPVLTLRVEPKRAAAPGGGKSQKDIKRERLTEQRRALSQALNELYRNRERLRSFAGKVQLVASMFEDSLAPTKTPNNLFAPGIGAQLVAPTRQGYLVEVNVEALPRLARFAASDTTVAGQVDISRVEKVHAFGADDVLRERLAADLWGEAPEFENGKGFLLSLTPFRDGAAREELLERLTGLAQEKVLLPTWPIVSLPAAEGADGALALPVTVDSQTSLAIGMRRYRNAGRARITAQIPSQRAFAAIVASGTVFRLEPIRKIELTTPGEGEEPGPLPPHLSNEPIVGVVDGGRTARSYDGAEAWRAPALVPNGIADHKHGNRVTALAVHGHAWNTNLPLPPLLCRVGTVQAVPKGSANYPPDPQKLIAYLERVMSAQRGTRVWNMSFNETFPCDPDEVSYLGREIAKLARTYGVLPVISAGNSSPRNQERIAPPADCEAAIVVAGRKFDGNGQPGGPCDVSLPGPGPEGMLKPDVSWYSTLRVLGGDVVTGTSYPTPLVASLAAHTFHNLKDPSADLVRALLLNRTDVARFEAQRGWGSPNGVHLPWTCQPGTVTLAWRGELRPGQIHYWERLPIPPSLTRNGRLHGKGVLTAVLNPHPMIAEETDANYFAARLEVALQYTGQSGETKNLLGTLKTSELREMRARAELHKWNPVRHTRRDFSQIPLAFSGDTMRLYARVFVRDLFQFNYARNDDVPPLQVAFVLSLSDGTENSDLYNEMRATLGNFVESAVLDQEIEIEP
jgi:hypothetical protein